jgi:RNA polymerase sigma-70 factor (ECF subfamily)
MNVIDLQPHLGTDAPPREVPVTGETRRRVDVAFRSYETRLFHAALRITGNEDDARDAVQDGLVNALRHADRFRGDAAVASWLYAIVVNAALYQKRRHRARKRGAEKYETAVWPEAETSFQAPAAARDPESYVLARVELARALDEIESLPREKRELVEQAIGGESCATMADRAGVPVAAIKSKLWRTRVALREQIEGGREAA